MTAAAQPPAPAQDLRIDRLPAVLVVDDEPALRHLLRVIIERLGYPLVEAADGRQALARLDEEPRPRVVLCDVRMPRMSGLDFLRSVRERDVFVVMMSAYASTDLAIEALRDGAYDFITKPFRPEEIGACLKRIVERERLAEENRQLRQQVQEQQRQDTTGFIGRSAAAMAVLGIIDRVAAYPSTVLLTGESGTGKELLARALHDRSDRASGPMVAVNCAAIPEALLESELFGHERGAFTGAVRAHAGLFERADGGTLLLDEIGELPLGLQAKLLRVLEDSRVRRVGGSKDLVVDVRVVAATARELEAEVAAARFRSDLFYRLNVVRVRIPPLRERVEDIPLLADALIERAARRLGRPAPVLSPQAARLLVRHAWPGNVRQLENALERAVLMAIGGVIEPSDLPAELMTAEPTPGEPGPEEADLSIKRQSVALERRLIAAALARTGGNRSQAARLLDISYKALVYKIRDYGLEE